MIVALGATLSPALALSTTAIAIGLCSGPAGKSLNNPSRWAAGLR
jgi:hypothetical protein